MIANTGANSAPIVTRNVVNWFEQPEERRADDRDHAERSSAVGRNFTRVPGIAFTTEVTMP